MAAQGYVLEREPNATAFQAQELALGDSVLAQIGVRGDVDYYAFTVSTADTVRIEALSDGAEAMDGKLWLFTAAGTLLASNDDYGGSARSRIVATLPAGTYHVRFSHYDTGANHPNTPHRRSEAPVRPMDDGTSDATRLNKTPDASPARSAGRPGAESGPYRLFLARFEPSAPAGPAIQRFLFSTGVELRGTVQPNGLPTATTFGLGMSAGAGHTFAGPTLAAALDGAVSTGWVRFGGLQPGTGYRAAFTARNDRGVASTDIALTTPPAGWTRVHEQPPIAQTAWGVDFVTDDVAVAATGVELWRSTDQGQTWTGVPNPSRQFLYGLHVVSPGAAFALGAGGTVLRSTDGGRTWTSVPTPSAASVYTRVAFESDRRVGAAVGYLGAARTDDGGATWTSLTTPHTSGDFNYYAVAVAPGDAAMVVAGFDYTGNLPVLMRSADRGATWQEAVLPISIETYATVRDVVFAGGAVALAATSYGQVMRSTDAGRTWTDATPPDPMYAIYDLVVVAPMDVIAVGQHNGDGPAAMRTRDGGLTWTSVETGTRWVSVLAAAVRGQTLLAAGSMRTLLRDDALSVGVERSGWVDAPGEMAVTPTPARGDARVRYVLAVPADVRLTLHDLLGRRLADIEAGARAAGAHAVAVRTDALAPGVYVFRLDIGGPPPTVRMQRLVVGR